MLDPLPSDNREPQIIITVIQTGGDKGMDYSQSVLWKNLIYFN